MSLGGTILVSLGVLFYDKVGWWWNGCTKDGKIIVISLVIVIIGLFSGVTTSQPKK